MSALTVPQRQPKQRTRNNPLLVTLATGNKATRSTSGFRATRLSVLVDERISEACYAVC